jgi:hypothetical protein
MDEIHRFSTPREPDSPPRCSSRNVTTIARNAHTHIQPGVGSHPMQLIHLSYRLAEHLTAVQFQRDRRAPRSHHPAAALPYAHRPAAAGSPVGRPT